MQVTNLWTSAMRPTQDQTKLFSHRFWPRSQLPERAANQWCPLCGCGSAASQPFVSRVPYSQVPEEVRRALDVQNEAMSSEQVESALRIPLSCGKVREDVDRQGEACTVVDVIFNDDVLAQSRAFRCAVLHCRPRRAASGSATSGLQCCMGG